jgi:hypothetical protein
MEKAVLLVLSLLTVAGCAGVHNCPSARSLRPARISHIVFIKLKDPADAPALIADSDKTLPRIRGVTGYACGQHLDMARANVIHDYDVGLFVGFETNDQYASYVQDPAHVAFVNTWAPKAEWLHIYDFADDTVEYRQGP